MGYLDWVKAIYFWQYDRESVGSFALYMIYAYRVADTVNKRKIASAFPELAKAMQDWEIAADHGNDLFRKVKLMD